MPGTPQTGHSTSIWPIDATQPYLVIAQTTCKQIIIREDRDSTPAQCDLQYAQPAGADMIRVPKGNDCVFKAPLSPPQVFKQGDVVGAIQTLKGACNVQQIEGY